MSINQLFRRYLAMLLCILFAIAIFSSHCNTVIAASSSYSKTINGVTVPFSGNDLVNALAGAGTGGSQCWGFATYIYKKIFSSSGFPYTYANNAYVTEYGKTIPTTADNLKTWILKAGPGAVLRVCNTSSPSFISDGGVGHSMVIVDADNNGVWIYQSGNLSKVFYINENGAVIYDNCIAYYTWNALSSYLQNGKISSYGQYIKYILYPGSDNFNINTQYPYTTQFYEYGTYKIIQIAKVKKYPYGLAELTTRTLNIGSTVKIKEAVINKYNNIWLKTENDDFIYGGYAYQNGVYTKTGDQYVQNTLNNVNYSSSGWSLPSGNLNLGSSFVLKGTFNFTNTLHKVVGEVYSGSKRVLVYEDSVPNKKTTSYSLLGSPVDMNLKFGSLPDGKYTFKLTVWYYYNRMQTIGFWTIKTQDFTVGTGSTITPTPITPTPKPVVTPTPRPVVTPTPTPKPISATSIKLNKTSATIKNGAKLTLVATLKPANASKDIIWSSSNSKIATVSKGIVTGLKPGKATITAKAIGGKTAKCTITVKAVTASKISLNKTKETLKVKETLSLLAAISPSNTYDKSLKWSSSNKKIATVSSSGKVTAIKKGTATITVKTANGKKATCKITVK